MREAASRGFEIAEWIAKLVLQSLFRPSEGDDFAYQGFNVFGGLCIETAQTLVEFQSDLSHAKSVAQQTS